MYTERIALLKHFEELESTSCNNAKATNNKLRIKNNKFEILEDKLSHHECKNNLLMANGESKTADTECLVKSRSLEKEKMQENGQKWVNGKVSTRTRLAGWIRH